MRQCVLITGGLGYIGGRVAQALAAAGYEVRLGTRQTSVPTPDWLPAAKLVLLDWASRSALESACEGVDVVVHLAAMNEIDCATNLTGALRANSLSTVELLEACINSGVRRFVYMSTAHIYGSPLTGRIDEETLPRPQHIYAITHRVAEDFVLAAHDHGRLEGMVLRLSNGFGVPMHAGINRWSLLVNDLCRQIVLTDGLRLKSSGMQYRDFVTLQDVARAVVHCLGLGSKAIGDGLFNLGGDCSLRVIDMAKRVCARWEAMTGTSAVLETGHLVNEKICEPLIYSSEKLKATGFVLESQFELEIDATLRLCLDSFGNKQKHEPSAQLG